MIATFIQLFAVYLVVFFDYMLLQVLVGGESRAGTVTAFKRSFGYISGRKIWYKTTARSGNGAVQGYGGDTAGNWDG